ncbi:ATP-binding protein [Sansalvadorimonas verongulae]|uniref:ATP-binding protein n=1 Tax=Sansalvadorimonas verongulae TaxID=2172824 RepID=UPI0012BBB77B|nr:ATP-binding protein [Sansalvadorimonas verongulae]MTI13024.1 ATP-binding protein [Sansalvadorimonas verongulae]
MSLPIIPAHQRQQEDKGVKAVLLGPSGVGKTSQLWTLPPEQTLFMDLEAGDLAVQGWSGDVLRPRTWPEFRMLVAFIGGPNPALENDQPYSQAHYQAACQQYGDPAALDKYSIYFIDSITALARLCFQWCKTRPEARSERTGKPDTRGAYGLHGREMIAALMHLQHVRHKHVIFVGILEERVDDFNRRIFQPQIEGSRTGLELPGIVDEVITMASLPDEEGQLQRTFVCQTLNPWGFPAKDRSGRLAQTEPAHLGNLLQKINQPLAERPLQYASSAPVQPSLNVEHQVEQGLAQ